MASSTASTIPASWSSAAASGVAISGWRTVADHARKLYFFESVLTPNTFWVDLKHVDFSPEKGKVKKLELGPGQTHIYSGDATAHFKDAEPFKFQGLPE